MLEFASQEVTGLEVTPARKRLGTAAAEEQRTHC